MSHAASPVVSPAPADEAAPEARPEDAGLESPPPPESTVRLQGAAMSLLWFGPDQADG